MSSSLLPFFRKKGDAISTAHVAKPSTIIDSKFLGLKTLVNGNIDCPYLSICVNHKLLSSRLVPPSLLKERYIEQEIKIEKERMEAEAEVAAEEEEEEEDSACWASYGRGNGRKLPPAIPLLARMANVSCMPWVMKRIYKEDGSLEIKEVRVKHHEYFRTRRQDGRLVLQLVGLDENCHLFKSGQKGEIQKNKIETTAAVVEHCDKPKESLLASGPSPTSPLFCSVEKDDKKVADFEAMMTKVKGDEVKSSREIMASMVMLSSSMPEPTFPFMRRKGCFSDDSPMHQMPISRMRPVHA